jgi:hypothetical protein
MAFTNAANWEIQADKDIRYIGNDHGVSGATYDTVIDFHRWLQDLADDAVASGDDLLDITGTNPSQRSTDNIITLINGYNIDDASAEHLFDGTIIQDGGDDIYDGIVNFGNADVQIQIHQNGAVLTDDWWNKGGAGSDIATSTGAEAGAATGGSATTLVDTGQSWATDEWVGYTVYNTTEGCRGICISNTATTITFASGGLYDGTNQDFAASDDYIIGVGLNSDANAGISHRFMIKVRSGGTDIDSRKLIGINRRFNKTYGEFKINGTSRGNNVLALSDANDLNNTTAPQTVDGYTGITNTQAGYNGIDVDDSTTVYFYSEWNANIPTRTINEFYERMKWITRDGAGADSTTLYGLDGDLFRGITTEVNIDVDSGTGTWATAGSDPGQGEALSWSGGTGWLLAVNDTVGGDATKLWMQILTGSAPGNSTTLTGGTSGATADTPSSSPVVDRSALISTPFCGASTGSAIIGSYGFGVEKADLTNSDLVFDLTNTSYTRPNLVTNSVTGLVSGEDRVIVAPWDGSSTDVNGDPAFDKDQLSLSGNLTSDNVSSITIAEAIPTDTPASGTLRLVDDDGYERLLVYSSWATSTFTLDTGSNEMTDNDYNDFGGISGSGTYQATSGNDVYITYLDQEADATSLSFQSTYDADRDLVIVVRDGGASPIKQFISQWSLTSANASIAVIRTTDE